MTETEQRIKIAEIRGWTITLNMQRPPYKPVINGYLTTPSDDPCVPDYSIPDYPHDLNAIREACLWAIDNLWDSDQVERFTNALERRNPQSTFTLNGAFDPYDAAQIIIRATAADWCHAFLEATNP